jgi:copper chaperone
MATKTVLVPGMSCGHCTHTVESELQELEGVKTVKADLETKKVTVEYSEPATWEKISSLLKEINYPAVETA